MNKSNKNKNQNQYGVFFKQRGKLTTTPYYGETYNETFIRHNTGLPVNAEFNLHAKELLKEFRAYIKKPVKLKLLKNV